MDIHKLIEITKFIANKPDHIQGPGGNTSVKFEEGRMAIKASGFLFSDMTEERGYALINYEKLALDYIETLENNYDEEQFESRLTSYRFKPFENVKPSMEVGFHSVLRNCVIHSHSVYANVFNCAAEGKDLLLKVFKTGDFEFINYINPGIPLSYAIAQLVKDRKKETPLVLFLENHGLIIHHDDASEAINLYTQVNNQLRNYFNFQEAYPQSEIKPESETLYSSNTQLLHNYVKNNLSETIFQDILFPDQGVFCLNNVSFEHDKDKKINIVDDQICYNTSLKEAKSIDEILMAYVFIKENILKQGLKLKTISIADMTQINNMKSEKHRKEIITK